MTTFEDKHPGLTKANSSYQHPCGNPMWDLATIHETQLDKQKVREAAGIHALVFRKEGNVTARKYIDYEHFMLELNL